MDPKYTHRIIEAHNVYSAHLQEDRTLKVYLPPNYNPEQTYPVLYCHDGLEFFTHGRIATLTNQLIDEGKIDPLIIAAIAVQLKTRNDDYAMSGNRHTEYVKFVGEECVPFVESKYRVSRNPADRFMAGISLGAVASMSIALQYPELFHNLILFSGAYYNSVQERIRSLSSWSELNAFMVVGRQETVVETNHGNYNFYKFNQTMRDLLRIRGAKVDYDEMDGTHIWGFWQKLIPASLEWMQGTRTTENGY